MKNKKQTETPEAPAETTTELVVEESLDDRVNAARSAIMQAVNPDYDLDIWVSELYEDFAIMYKDEKYYKVNYTIGEDGTASLGEWIEVEQAWQPVQKAIWQSKKAIQRHAKQDDNLVFFGGSVKAVGNGIVEGYALLFTTKDDPDLERDYFDKSTDLGIVDGNQVPVYYQHGLDATMKTRRIGRGTAKIDDVGVFLQAQLDLRDDYERAIYDLAEKGKLGWSTQAAGTLVEREVNGKSWHIKSWPIAEASLTPTPAEPRTSAVPAKSLKTSTVKLSPVRGETETKTGETEMEKEEIVTLIKDTVKEALGEDVKIAIADSVKAAIEALPAINAGGIAAPNFKKVTDLGFTDDAKAGFLHWCKTGQINGALVEAKAALQGQTDTEGGFLVPDDMYGQIVEKTAADSWIRRAGVQIVPTSLDRYPFPIEDTAMTKFVVTAEEGNADENEPTFAQAVASIYRLTKLVKASVQVLDDNKYNLEAYLIRAFARAKAAAENYYCTVGSGSGEPQGVLTGATSSAITTAGATAITTTEMTSLRGKLGEGYQNGAMWLMQFATKNYLQGLTGNPFQFIPTPAGDNDSILQHPAITSPDMEALAATKKAVLYGNPWYYGVAERAQMSVQRLVELYAVSGQVGFLAAFRMGAVVLQAEAWQYMTQHS